MSLLASFRRILSDENKKGGGQDIHHPQGDHMLQQTMVLPDIKSKPEAKGNGLFSVVDAQKTRRAKAWFEDRLQKGREGTFTEIVELTPALAELLLANNPDNRALKPLKLAAFEADIGNGRWELNGESLKVSKEGLLNDGQHRCHAVITTGRSIKTFITFGVSRDSRLTVDQGAVRTVGDYLSMEGISNGNHCASVAMLLFLASETGYVKRSYGAASVTKVQVREAYHANPGIIDSIHAVPKKGSALVGGLTNLAFCHFMFALKDRAAADEFIRKLVRGDELKSSDPIYVARQRLMTDKRLRPEEKIEVIFRAWNAVRTRRPLRSIPIHGRLPGIER